MLGEVQILAFWEFLSITAFHGAAITLKVGFRRASIYL